MYVLASNCAAGSGAKMARACPVFKHANSRRPRAIHTSATRSEAASGAIAAASAAALFLSSCSPLQASEVLQPSVSTSQHNNPIALVADKSTSRSADGGLLQKLLNVGKSKIPSPVKEDPFGADRAQQTEVADTKRPIPIITEQEAVAPEAFPNPSQNISPKPPVLAGAEGDESSGPNAGQFKGLTSKDRQGLINKKSPAQATASAGTVSESPVSFSLGGTTAAPQITTAVNPTTDDLAEQQGGLLEKLKSVLPKPPTVNEDPFGADRYQGTTIADTKRPMPIITEQEAVAPEAFPNPSQDRSPKPPVLAAAESDEHLGCNANQFEGIDESCRQALIDAKSPAQATGTTGSRN